MQIKTFLLERNQSLYENIVDYNLGDSGAHPLSLKDILSAEEITTLLNLPLGYGNTKGSNKLREAIASKYGCASDELLVTNGTAEANFFAAFSLIEANDEIIYIVPNYLQLQGLAECFGAKIFLAQWDSAVKDITKALSPKTKMIALCNPNNPTGQNMSQEDISAIIKMAKSVSAYLLVDEVYREEEIFGKVQNSIYGQYEKTIINSSLSKAFGFPGLRLGWTIGPKDYLEQVSIRKDYTTIAPNIMSDYIATCLLSNPTKCQEILELNKTRVQLSYFIFETWAQEFKEIFEWKRPEAGAMVYVKYSLPIKSSDLMQKILQDKNILIVAGEDYDMENHIRIGLGLESKDLKIALEKIAEVIREIRANIS